VRGEDLTTGLPPNLENGVPPPHGYAGLTWTPDSRWWGEIYTQIAARQSRLSTNDMAQPRIGASRTASAVRDYFNNGAVAAGLVSNGLLLATGENVNQVIARVIGPNASAVVPLYTYNPAFATLNVRAGWKVRGAASLTIILENLFDANYRVMGSGVDGAGFNVVVRFSTAFYLRVAVQEVTQRLAPTARGLPISPENPDGAWPVVSSDPWGLDRWWRRRGPPSRYVGNRFVGNWRFRDHRAWYRRRLLGSRSFLGRRLCLALRALDVRRPRRKRPGRSRGLKLVRKQGLLELSL
jgi:hypothetical protein